MDIITTLLNRDGVEKGDQILFRCPFHNDSNPSCSYNKDKQIFQCFACGESGYITKLTERLNNEIGNEYPNLTIDKTQRPATNWPTVSKEYVALTHRVIFSSKGKKGLDYLQNRGLSFKTIIDAQLGYDTVINAITIPYLDSQGVFFIKLRFLSEPYPNGQKYGAAINGSLNLPYNVNALALENVPRETIIITEGELDALSSMQMAPNIPAWGIPGKEAFKEQWVKLFDDYDKIYICFDNDGKTDENINKISELLGKHRCYQIKLPNGVKDINDLLSTNSTSDVYLDLIYKAQALGMPVIRSITSYIETSAVVYSQGLHSGISTGHELIDGLFGGFRPGDLTILSAYPGTGKTTLALEIAKNVAEEHKVMLGLFENNTDMQTVPDLAALYHKKQYIGLSPEQYYQFIANVPTFKNILMVDRFSKVTEAELTEAYRQASKSGAKLIILDHLHFMTSGAYDVSNVVKMMEHITKLARYQFTTLSTILVVQPTKADMRSKQECPHTGKWMPILDLHSIKGGTSVIENASNVLLLQRDGLGVYMESAKVRSNATTAKAGDSKVRVEFDKEHFAFSIKEYTKAVPKEKSTFEW